MDDELMLIGRFAQLSGLSIGTLRHYDEVGLLSPASVDQDTGYRRYRRGQLERAWQKSPVTGCRPVQIKIAVEDLAAGVAFYQEAFGLHYDVIRRAEDTDYSAFMFGTHGHEDFFILVLLGDKDRLDYPGPSTFGLNVPDLDECHGRALAAGATEAVRPHDAVGMPRCSAVRDPSGNWIWLYQA